MEVMKWGRDLLFVLAASTAFLAVLRLAPDVAALRIFLGLPLLLLFPGYALVSLLWPAGGKRGPCPLERLVYSLAFSLVITTAVSLYLLSLQNLELASFLWVLYIVLWAATLGALFRRWRLPEDERCTMEFKGRLGDAEGPQKALLALSLVVLVVGAGFLVYDFGWRAQPTAETRLYILGEKGELDDYPTALATGEVGTVRVGVENHEGRAMDYVLRASWQNDTPDVEGLAGCVEGYGNMTAPYPMVNDTYAELPVSLEDGTEHSSIFSFTAEHAGTYNLAFSLFRGGEAEAFKEVNLWVEVRA